MDAHHHHQDDEEEHEWKVSDRHDQLDMLCEQHQHQTEHHDGLPDWPSHPQDTAGVASEAHVHVPANFAWTPKDRSDDHDRSGVAHALQQKEAHPAVLPPPPPPSALLNHEKRHFNRTWDETSQSQRGVTKRHYDATPGDDREAASRIKELRLETHKFLNNLAHLDPSSSSSQEVAEDEVKSSCNLGITVSFQDGAPPLSADPCASVATEERRPTDKPGTERHWDSQYARGRGSGHAKQATTAEAPRKPSKRFAPQPQASIFPIMETKRFAAQPQASSCSTTEAHYPKFESLKQPEHVNPRYRTSYSDANAWIHPDAALQTATDELKARQVLDAAAWTGTNCEHRYVLTAASALRVAKESAREFLGEHLHVNHVKKSGASTAADSRVTRDEANQTELEPCVRVLQLPKVESSSQTDANMSIAHAAAMPVASNKITCRASALRKAPNRFSGPTEATLKPQKSIAKTRIVHENPKTPVVKSFLSQHQGTASPLLLYPRYPPEPTIFRAKSTYTTEFGRAPVKKRIAAR